MIVDLCKPLNEGESNTVRIILSVHEAHKMINAYSYEAGYRVLDEAMTSALSRDLDIQDKAPSPKVEPGSTPEWAIQDTATGRYYSGFGSGRICAWGGRVERFPTFRRMVADLANPDMPETARPVPAPQAPATLTDDEIHAWWRARPYLTVHPSALQPDRIMTALGQEWTVEDTRPKGHFFQGDTLENALRSAAEWIR